MGKSANPGTISASLSAAVEMLAASRPTAVNLRWALDRLLTETDLEAAAVALHTEDIRLNTRLGENGAHLLSGTGWIFFKQTLS